MPGAWNSDKGTKAVFPQRERDPVNAIFLVIVGLFKSIIANAAGVVIYAWGRSRSDARGAEPPVSAARRMKSKVGEKKQWNYYDESE